MSICSMFNALLIRCFKLVCTARVTDCKHELSDVTNIYYTVPYRMVARIGICEKEPIIGVQWGQKKSQPSGPPFSGKLGKPRFPLERWALGLGFFCPHCTPMMDSIYLTHAILPRTSSNVIR